mmetsp:Transcript_18521/g.24077  ORF Transcript_18521/g.24077 Transcript_18521/m.24077 type:complete len:303 (+) Transcript_18521:77-985(+)
MLKKMKDKQKKNIAPPEEYSALLEATASLTPTWINCEQPEAAEEEEEEELSPKKAMCMHGVQIVNLDQALATIKCGGLMEDDVTVLNWNRKKKSAIVYFPETTQVVNSNLVRCCHKLNTLVRVRHHKRTLIGRVAVLYTDGTYRVVYDYEHCQASVVTHLFWRSDQQWNWSEADRAVVAIISYWKKMVRLDIEIRAERRYSAFPSINRRSSTTSLRRNGHVQLHSLSSSSSIDADNNNTIDPNDASSSLLQQAQQRDSSLDSGEMKNIEHRMSNLENKLDTILHFIRSTSPPKKSSDNSDTD